MVDTHGDCNDDVPEVRPMVIEQCNGFDDNCNAIVDEGSARVRRLHRRGPDRGASSTGSAPRSSRSPGPRPPAPAATPSASRTPCASPASTTTPSTTSSRLMRPTSASSTTDRQRETRVDRPDASRSGPDLRLRRPDPDDRLGLAGRQPRRLHTAGSPASPGTTTVLRRSLTRLENCGEISSTAAVPGTTPPERARLEGDVDCDIGPRPYGYVVQGANDRHPTLRQLMP
jgi:hypothetical protein